jgi:hypothetical protein
MDRSDSDGDHNFVGTNRAGEINASFVEAAKRLGLTARPQASGRRPGGLTRAKVPKKPALNPSLEGRIGSHAVSVINYAVSGEKATGYETRCLVETQDAMLPAGVSVRLRLAGPFGANLNPIALFMERLIGLGLGSARRPRPRGSPKGFLTSPWVQLDEVPDTGFLDGFMVAGRFSWPDDAEPPPYGQPEAVMTAARTIAARKLLEPGDVQRRIELDSSTLRFTSHELTTADDLVNLVRASSDLVEAMLG